MKKSEFSEIYFPKVTQSVDDGIRLWIQLILFLGTFILGIDRGVIFNRYLRIDGCNLERGTFGRQKFYIDTLGIGRCS